MAGTVPIEFLGIRPLYDEGVIARFELELPADFEGMPQITATTGGIVRRAVNETHIIGERPGANGARMLTVSLRHRTYRWGFRLTASGRRSGGQSLRASRSVSFDECRASERAWLEERRNVQNDDAYDAWFRAHRADEDELARQREKSTRLERKAAAGDTAAYPLMSVITPVFRPPAAYLRAMGESVLAQTYPNFELVLANASGECPEVDEVLAELSADERVRVIKIENRSIAENTNEAIAAAAGDYLAFVDHDDLLEPDALFAYASAIRENPEADLLFCDEDMWGVPDDAVGAKSGDGAAAERFFGPKFKPGWNPSRLIDGNIVCHMLMVSRTALEQVELSPAELTGAQDYDLTLKAYEVARDVVHVPKMLYHWRSYPSSSATNLESKPYLFEAGRRAVQAHFDRLGIAARVGEGSYPLTYRTRFAPAQPTPRVHCLPMRDALAGAMPPDDAEFVLILGEGATLDDGCEEELVGVLARVEVGLAAPIALDPDGLVASAGLTLRPDGERTPMSAGLAATDVGYSQFLRCNHDATAVAASCVVLRAEDYRALDGLDSAFADDAEAAIVDLCLRIGASGRFCCVVATAHARMSSTGVDHASHADDLLARYPHIANGDSRLGAHLDPASPFYQLDRS